ncbi:hypothetical protein [Nocardia gipuzkoensis]
MISPEFQLRMAMRVVGNGLSNADSLDSELRDIDTWLRPLVSSPLLGADPLFWEIEGVADPVEVIGSVLAAVVTLRRQLSEIDADLLEVRKLVKRLDIEPDPGPAPGEGVAL